MGGFVMTPLAVVGVLLWYALVYRLIVVRVSRKAPRLLVEMARKHKVHIDSVTADAAVVAVEMAENAQTLEHLKSLLNEKFSAIKRELNQYKALVRALVAVAPLLGLLGTVDGMIETFSALGDMALFTQSGGIAGGISRALFTTQIGLAISIPGLLIGRIVERRQNNIYRELDQIRDLVCAMKVST
jgi:biopolymer transport protein ExbB